MARPRQPIELIMAKGKKNLTKKEIEERKNTEVRAKRDNIVAPSYLTDDLKEEFNRIASELINIEIMSNLDCEALARFIVSESQYQKVTLKILKMKTIGPTYVELLKVQEKLFKMCRQSASDLGLTISSRCKLVIPKKEENKEKTEEEKMFGSQL
ncbi:phage terminase, small subunit, putative, P27 family [Gottschalkia purinilytica]|uniref:Phage terminase, small subunit, putative, P27 family n=1 Tax=Gottschalkia purinilytica TaxID=1503 RepID=A0A0L0W685_GOTPU|nr:phage terminase small subunit P27 family [Gottschalkia purinilytica]KNF06996.1 phage terminase, small subunit, putative, P27 family [Gottschalkia purinilytica]